MNRLQSQILYLFICLSRWRQAPPIIRPVHLSTRKTLTCPVPVGCRYLLEIEIRQHDNSSGETIHLSHNCFLRFLITYGVLADFVGQTRTSSWPIGEQKDLQGEKVVSKAKENRSSRRTLRASYTIRGNLSQRWPGWEPNEIDRPSHRRRRLWGCSAVHPTLTITRNYSGFS